MVPKFMIDNKNKEQKYHKEFKEIFGVSLKDYFDYMTGFDIVGFDEKFLKVPDGTSTSDFIKKKYGDKAVLLVANLL